MTSILRTIKSANSDVLKYIILTGLIGFSYFGLVVVLFNLYLLRLGYDTRFIGVANACMPTAFALTGIVSGILGRKWGNKRTSALAILFLILGVSLLPLTEYLASEIQQSAIISLRMLSGMGFSLFYINLLPYIVAATTPKERVLIFSLQTATGPAAGVLGALFASFLPSIIAKILRTEITSPLPFAYLLIFSGIILIPAIPMILTTRERLKKNTPETPERQINSLQPIIIIILFLCLSATLRTAGMEVTQSFFNVYLEIVLNELPQRIGLIMAAGQLTAIPAALLSSYFVKYLGKVNGIVLATFLTGIGLVATIVSPHWLVAALGYAITVGSRTIVWTLLSVVQMEIVPPEIRGITSGSVGLCAGLGFGSMALIGGYLIPILGFGNLYLIGAALSVLSAFIFWIYFRHPRGEYSSTKNLKI